MSEVDVIAITAPSAVVGAQGWPMRAIIATSTLVYEDIPESAQPRAASERIMAVDPVCITREDCALFV